MSTILSLAPYKFLPPANGGNWAIFLADKILAVHNDIHAVGLPDNKYDSYPIYRPYPVLDTGKHRYLPYSQYKKVLAVAQAVAPDYIFCHHHYMFPMVRKVAKKLGVPAYIRSQNIEAERFRSIGRWWWPLMRAFEKWCYRNADAVFFITENDREAAIQHYGLREEQAVVMPFAIEIPAKPTMPAGTRAKVASDLNLNPDIPWLFFMGQLDYYPNSEAVELIIKEILPLLRKDNKPFQILICGRNLPEALQTAIQQEADAVIKYLGFVPDINEMIEACDVLLNPVLAGGGIKTKVVESLAWNKMVVSTMTGAEGIEPAVCNNKLRLVQDNDWQAFTAAVWKAVEERNLYQIEAPFFDFYYVDHIAGRMQAYFK
jgi:glycosyltransferase involved in cell wall biosynthesis